MFLVFFCGCSLAIFLGNGESSLGGSLESVKVQSYLTWPLLILTLLFLVPMVRFKSVVNSAREGAPAWQAIAARFVIGGACTLTPFFLVHWLGRENISGWVKTRDPDLLREDVTQWPEYLHWRRELAGAKLVPLPLHEAEITRRIKQVAEYDNDTLGGLTHERHSRQSDFDFKHWNGLQRAKWLLAYLVRGDHSVIGIGLTKLRELRWLKEENVEEFNESLGLDALTLIVWFRLLVQHTATPTSTELWIDWLRWGYTADCAQSAPLPINRLRQVDPRAEGLVFGPERDLRWRDWLEDAHEGFNRYLADAKTREQSLLRVSQLLGDEPVRPSTPLTAGELVRLILACHDLRADFPCANRRDLFEVGGRRHMIFAATVALSQLNDCDPKSSSGKKDKDKTDEDHATLEARCKLAATFYRHLCRGVFSGGNSRTAALATLCLLEQIILYDNRTPQWRQSLDCVAALVKLTEAGKLWVANDLILSWYQLPVTRGTATSSPTSAASEKTESESRHKVPLEFRGSPGSDG